MKTKPHVSYMIDLTFGSERQEELFAKMLPSVLQVLKLEIESKHKNNSFIIKSIDHRDTLPSK